MNLPLLENSIGTPIAKRGMEYALSFILNPSSDTIHPVMVVPILAPIIIPADSTSVNSPAFTKDTVITVVADEDCTSAVVKNPVPTPRNLFFVIDLRMFLN